MKAGWQELGISEEDWAQTPSTVKAVLLSLYAQVQVQAQQIQALQAEVASLREQVNRHSGNSSQPPSSDGPKQKAEKKKLGQGRGRRKHGGQKGHAGHERKLIEVEAVDEVIVHKPSACAGCGSLLLGADPAPRRYQVTDIPPLQAIVTEHQVHELTCACCGQISQGETPDEVKGGAFGPNLSAMVGLWLGAYRLSKRQVQKLLREVYGVEISLGGIMRIQQRLSEALSFPVEQALEAVKEAPFQHLDETSWREAGADKQGWLWVAASEGLTVFQVALSRAGQEVKRFVHELGESMVASDRYSAYSWLDPSRRQICWAHLLRDFEAIRERGGPSEEVGEVLLILSREWLALWQLVREGKLSRQTFIDKHLPGYQKAIHRWLERGLKSPHSKTVKTCAGILKLEAALWNFPFLVGLEPTNNVAERALRHAVIWRRISYGTQSAAGSRFVERILTCLATCRQQSRDLLAFLRQALLAQMQGTPPPSLLPA